jgi:DNA invertase Pin-like site-specific DNA recombinase
MRKNKTKQQEEIVLEKKLSDTEPDNNLFCYLRVSTQEQNDKNHSIDRQRTYGKKIAKKLGKNYIEMNEGGTSSVERKDDTKFKFLQTLITEGKVKHLWYYHRSRWTRTQEEDIVIKRTLLEKFRVKVYEGESGKLRNTSEPTDDFLDNILSSVQELDRLSRRQTSVSGKKHVSKKYGDKMSRHMGGTVTFGYQNIDKLIVVHPENSKHLKKIYEMYSQGKSTKDIKFYLETIQENMNHCLVKKCFVDVEQDMSHNNIKEVIQKKVNTLLSHITVGLRISNGEGN